MSPQFLPEIYDVFELVKKTSEWLDDRKKGKKSLYQRQSEDNEKRKKLRKK